MRRAMGIGAGLTLAAGLGRMVPGCTAPSFVCESDESCAGLLDGRCEADGHCSIPDADCLSGRRYAAHSGEVSDECVGEAATGTSATDGRESDGESTSEGGPTSLDGSSTAPLPTTGTDPSGEPARDPCEGAPSIVDDPFAALPIDIDHWSVFNDIGIALNVLDDQLVLSALEVSVASSNLSSAFALPPIGYGGVELTTVPAPDAPAEAYLLLTDLDVEYGFRVSEGQLVLYYTTDELDEIIVAAVPYDPVAHRWQRFGFDAEAELLVWEVAAELGHWEAIDSISLAIGFDVTEARLAFGAGVWKGPLTAEPLAAFGHAFVCER